MAFSDYNASASLNTTCAGMSVGEGMARSDVNNVLRQLMADGKQLSDELDSTVTAVSAQAARSVSPSSWGQPRVFDFTRYLTAETIPDLKVYGSPTAAINGSAQLEVVSDYSDGTKRVFLRDFTFRDGMLRAKIIRGAFMIAIYDQVLGGRRVLYSSNGTTLEVGMIDASGNVYSLGTPNTLAGTAGQTIWVEMQTGPMAQTTIANARSWLDGAARPASPDVFGAYPAGVVGKELNEGYVSFQSFGATPAKFLRVEAYDGSLGTAAQGGASYNGLWFPGFEGGVPCMCTTRGGDSFAMIARGTADIAIEYAGTLGVVSSNVPAFDVYVNGVRVTAETDPPKLFTNANAAGVQGLTLGLSLDPTVATEVEVRIRGIHEANDKWLKRAGVSIVRVYATTAGGIVAPKPDDRPAFMLVSDSTGEAIVARGTPSSPSNSAGDLSWFRKTCDALGYKALHNAFGGTGLLTAGSGAMPDARSFSRYYIRGRQIDFAKANAKKLMLLFGTNDNANAISTGSFATALTTLIQQAFQDHPGLEHLIVAPSFVNQYYKAQMQSVVSTLNDPRLKFFDTATISGLTTTDGTHPGRAAQQTIATAMIAYIRSLPAVSFA